MKERTWTQFHAMQRCLVAMFLATGLTLCLGTGVLAGEIQLSAAPAEITEGATQSLTLSAALPEGASVVAWEQTGGPKVRLIDTTAEVATADLSEFEIAAECDLTFAFSAVLADGSASAGTITVPAAPIDITPVLEPNRQVGGASTSAVYFTAGEKDWCLFNIGTALRTNPVDLTSEGGELVMPAFVHDAKIISYKGNQYALVALGEAGVGIVDLTDPALPVLEDLLPVNYLMKNVTFAEGGGSILTGNTMSSEHAPVMALETDGTHLYMADTLFGIHKTSLGNVFNGKRETDNTLFIEQEKNTIQYAGEHPWGGPCSLKLYNGKLFAAMGVLGLGIFDPGSLEQVGRYNLYTDEARTEDYFGAMAISQDVHKDPVTGEPYLDAFTGMPDYRQTNYEIAVVMRALSGSSDSSVGKGGNGKGKSKVQADDAFQPTPWAKLERQGKWFYMALDADVAQQGERTIAYIAFGLGGVVAVDVTGFENASPGANFLNAQYLGYFPAVPANGPETTGSNPASLLPYEGAGKLKESGVRAVRVQGDTLYMTDHFAGLVVLENAATPDVDWYGPETPYHNDTDMIPNNAVPDYESITSYDMSPWDPADNESLPMAFFQAPCLLATAELNGHGNTLALMPNIDMENAGQIDILEASGAGGFVYVDLIDMQSTNMANRFAIVRDFPPTDEIGAFPDGSAGETIAIGHSSGIAATQDYIYVSDGPHGISAWAITDDQGYPSNDIHLVANTVQDEYPQTVNGETIYPPSHTVRNVIDPSGEYTWSLCARNGLRRVPIAAVENGEAQVGAPLMLKVGLTDIWEHNNELNNIEELNFQDHAYDVELDGDYAFVADGSNGLTVYDTTKDPSVPGSGFFVNFLGSSQAKPMFGTAHGVDLWTDPTSGRKYAVIASGPRGVGVADVTDVMNMQVIKVFEPIKLEDGKVGSADGKASDVQVIGDIAYFTYDSFGIVSYSMADLIAPIPEGVEPTEIFKKQMQSVLYDYRPEALGRFKLQEVPGYEDVDGAAIRFDYTQQNGRLYLYVAFGLAGVAKVDFTDPTTPVLLDLKNTAAECSEVAISNGRLYVADGLGGIVFFK